MNPLAKETREAIKRTAKYLICCGIEPRLAHNIARAEVLGGIVKA